MTLTAAGNHPDERDPDRDDRICNRIGCVRLATMTDDYCPFHVEEHERERLLSDEPDDPDAQYDDEGI